MPPKVWVGLLGNGWHNERHVLYYCWNSVEKNFNEFMIIHEASWTMSCCVQQWKQHPSCVSKCDSHSSTVYYDWAPDCYWEVNLLLEKTFYWNWSLWGACSFGIRKRLGLCDVKHLTNPEAPPWQNTQLPFGALGCDSGDIAGSKIYSTYITHGFIRDPSKSDEFGDACWKLHRDIRDRTNSFPCQGLLQSQPQCRFQTGSMSSALGKDGSSVEFRV